MTTGIRKTIEGEERCIYHVNVKATGKQKLSLSYMNALFALVSGIAGDNEPLRISDTGEVKASSEYEVVIYANRSELETFKWWIDRAIEGYRL